MVISFTEVNSNCSNSDRIYLTNKAVHRAYSSDSHFCRNFFRFAQTKFLVYCPDLDSFSRILVSILIILSLSQMTVASRTPSFPEFQSPRSLSYSQRDALPIGEKILEKGRLMPQGFDAIEFPVVIPKGRFVKTLRYVIAKPRFWLTITPCTNRLDRIQFTTTRASRVNLKTNSRYALVLNSTSSARRRYNQSITVERFPGSPQLPNVSISDDEREILNLERSRIHYTSRRYSGSALEVQLYGRPGDAFLVRMSIRESPTHTFTGYPELSNPQLHSVCLVDGTSDTLKIRWAAALSDDMQPQYCVSINAEENLYYQCTAYARLNASILRQYGTLDRPASFGKTEQLRPRTINNFVYTCLPNKTLQVRLPPALALSLPRLGKDASAKLFINVYAVNTRVSLSTAYAVRVLDRPVERCGSVRQVDVMKVHSLPSFHKIRWATDIEFELPAGVRQFEAFYQTCKIPGDFTAKLISVQLYHIRETSSTPQRIEVCRQPIIDSRIHAICSQNHTGGYYLLQVKGPAGINHSQESGRFYLRQPNTYGGILRPASTEFSTRITRVLTNSTSEPYLKSPESITVKPFYVISAATSRWRENDLSHMVKRGYRNVGNLLRLRRRRRRRLLRHASHIPFSPTSTTSYLHGLGIGIDCQGPQVYARLRIHSSSQYYWIYTTPIPFWMMKRRREWLFARLNNMTDHCAYPSAYYSVITNNTWRGMKCLSTEGQEELRFLIPAYDHVNDPPFHLITIYIAHRKDVHGERKELLTQELFDACRLHASNCYRNKTDSPCALRAYGMSDDPKYTYRLIRTQHQVGTQCWSI
ncbi:hypothetical protein CRM22_001327 [Opisthorchis felineus]|uniref:Uncharacterized protein n=1 Tax=Opisthorchis felineus TaxID=147828 RepID=A0A4S2MB77_OPIFE|nr:hypothetical protein CRM22_001327 [Opisthorchis felineus]